MQTLKDIAAQQGWTYRQAWYRLHRCRIPHVKRGQTIYADPGDFYYLPIQAGYPRKRAQRRQGPLSAQNEAKPDMFLL